MDIGSKENNEDFNRVLYDPYLINLLEIHNQSEELFSIFHLFKKIN